MSKHDILKLNAISAWLSVLFATKLMLCNATKWAASGEEGQHTVKTVGFWHELILTPEEEKIGHMFLKSLPSFARKVLLGNNSRTLSRIETDPLITNKAIKLNVVLIEKASNDLIELYPDVGKATRNEIDNWFQLLKLINKEEINALVLVHKRLCHTEVAVDKEYTRFHHMSLFIYISYMTKFQCEKLNWLEKDVVTPWEIWSGVIYQVYNKLGREEICCKSDTFAMMSVPWKKFQSRLNFGLPVDALKVHEHILIEMQGKMQDSCFENLGENNYGENNYEQTQFIEFEELSAGTIQLIQSAKTKILARKKFVRNYLKNKRKRGTIHEYQPRPGYLMEDRFIMGTESYHYIFVVKKFSWEMSTPVTPSP
jgi:hypothetical protein